MTTDTVDAGPCTRGIHEYFGLTYAGYLVMHRTLLQSMPDEWQARFVRMLDEFDAAFDHVEQAEGYNVQAADFHEVTDLDPAQLAMCRIAVEERPCEDDHDHTPPPRWRRILTALRILREGVPWDADCLPVRVYSDIDDGYREMRTDEMVGVPVTDPVPHYRRGRERVAPRLPLVPGPFGRPMPAGTKVDA